METIELIIVVLFAGTLLSWLVSQVFGSYEYLSMESLKLSLYKKGKLVLNASEFIPIDEFKIQAGDMYETDSCKLKFISSHECLFFCRKLFFRWFGTKFNIKGHIFWHNGKATIEGRIPMGIYLSYVFLLSGLAILGLFSFILEPTDLSARIILRIIIIAVWVFVFLMYRYNLSTEKRRAFMVINEFKWLVRGGQLREHKVSP